MHGYPWLPWVDKSLYCYDDDKKMIVSLVITTFNWKEALELSLRNVLSQTRPPDEIIIADDGSSDGSRELVAEIAAATDVNIIYAWQADKGFRAARSRNRAIAMAKGDYVILIDGDIVVEKHFVEDHLSVARRRRFVQGTRVLVNKIKTQDILRQKHLELTMISSGLGNRKNCLRSRLLANVLSYNKTGLSGIKTCNFAFWRQDALDVNGFNEDFIGWGREDSEFASRLMNRGIKRHNLKFMAVAFHLYHKDCRRERLSENNDLLGLAVSQRYTYCDNGIKKYGNYL